MTVTEIMLRENLGGELRLLRERRDLSLAELVEKMDGEAVTAQAICRIELGQRQPRASTLVALARGLDVEFRARRDGLVVVIEDEEPKP